MALWKMDTAHSEVKFKVKHLVISTVTGHFNQYDASAETNKEDFSDAKISFEADVNSIDTKNEHRDGHLNSKSGGEFELHGDLTVKGITKPVKLDVVHNGTVKGFGGSFDVAAFEISGKINRQDFGLTWSALTETGGVVVSDDVKFEILAEFKKA